MKTLVSFRRFHGRHGRLRFSAGAAGAGGSSGKACRPLGLPAAVGHCSRRPVLPEGDRWKRFRSHQGLWPLFVSRVTYDRAPAKRTESSGRPRAKGRRAGCHDSTRRLLSRLL